MIDDLLFRLRALFRRNRVETELDEELRFHIEGQRAKYLRAGMSAAEAERRARIEFGGVDEVKEECRDARGVRLLEVFAQDVRYGLRGLRRSPGFTAVALITLALGIGATTAIFSVAYGVLLRPLPYADADRVMLLHETSPRVGRVSVSYPNFLDWRQQSHAFSAMAHVSGVSFLYATDAGDPEPIPGQAVSSNFLSLLGVHPAIGRDFEASEDKAGATPVAIVSYGFWQSRLGGQASAVGRTIRMNNRSFTVIGVLPAGFRWTDSVQVLEPDGPWLSTNKGAMDRGGRHDTDVAGRLAPGVSIEQARSEMSRIAAGLAQAYPKPNRGVGAAMRPIRDEFVDGLQPAILILMGAVTFVLLIACANVANLFLMRAAGRGREMALRMAIGATRGRIVGQLLTEGLILAVAGGALGLVLAFAGARGIAALMTPDQLMGAEVSVNGVVLLFNLGAALLAALIFGLAPALQAAKTGVQARLAESGKATTASAAQNWRRMALVAAEVALAVILLAGAGLMFKSLSRLMAVDVGVRTDRVLTLAVGLRDPKYRNRQAAQNYWAQFMEGVRALPGVESAALGTSIPLSNDHSRADITIEGVPPTAQGILPHPDYHVVSSDYVRTIGAHLLRGREFTDADNDNAPLVGMINARVARELFGKDDPIGRRFTFGAPEPGKETDWITIVGVLGDTKLYGLDQPSRLEVYTPLRQSGATGPYVLVKSAVDPAALSAAVRRVGAGIDRGQPIFDVQTMEQRAQEALGIRRVALILFGMFSGLALALAGIGIYGVISYSVAQRTQEMGIRMALGAAPFEVLRLVMWQGGRMAGLGALIGIPAALVLTRAMTKLLYAIEPTDPATFAAIPIVLGAVALLACYVPARRTMRVDPLTALRHE